MEGSAWLSNVRVGVGRRARRRTRERERILCQFLVLSPYHCVTRLTPRLVVERPARARRDLARERVHVKANWSRHARGGRVLKGIGGGVEHEICRSWKTFCAQRLASALRHLSRIATLAFGLSGLICELADTALCTCAQRCLSLAYIRV